MPSEDNKRLDRIEEKIDKMADALISLARAEEKLHNMESKYSSQYDRMNKFSVKLDDIEKKVDENARTTNIINKLFWTVVVAISGTLAAQIWPVSVIRANSETLLDGALDNKKDAKIFAKAILHNSERLSLMVSDLIDLSRIEYGDLKLNIVSIDLDSFINSFIVSMKSLTKKKGIDILYKPAHKTKIKADVQALERILTNLIDNAFKYSPDESLIEISTKQDDNNVRVMVADNGVGISEIDKGHIFDRFYRAASARASHNKGSGLGLAIVKNLVNSLNGDVGVSSGIHKGSTFWFTLPSGK